MGSEMCIRDSVFIGLADGGSATKAAFLLQAAVVFTPCILALTAQPVRPRVWLGSVIALFGVLLLATDVSAGGADGASSAAAGLAGAGGALTDAAGAIEALGALGVCPADTLFLGAALAWSLTICRQGSFATSAELSSRVVEIQAAKNVALAALLFCWFGAEAGTASGSIAAQWPGLADDQGAWLLVGCSALGCELLGDLLQALGAKGMPATEANVLLSSEPLWAALLTSAMLHERLTATEWAGGAVLVLAGVIATTGGASGAGGGRDGNGDAGVR